MDLGVKPIGPWRLGGMALALASSIAVLLAGQVWAVELGEASRLAICLTPWVLLAGWPAPHGVRRDWPLVVGLALPVWALCAWIDLNSGLPIEPLRLSLASALWLILCLGESRFRAAQVGLRAYTFLWFGLLLVLPALTVAMAWGQGGLLGDGGRADQIARWSPLQMVWRQVSSTSSEVSWSDQSQSPALWACMLLLVFCSLSGRRGTP
jgi:hypothetical protein